MAAPIDRGVDRRFLLTHCEHELFYVMINAYAV